MSLLGSSATICSELVERKEREKRTAELEHDEIVGLEDDGPAKVGIECSFPHKVLHAERRDVCKRDTVTHAGAIPKPLDPDTADASIVVARSCRAGPIRRRGLCRAGCLGTGMLIKVTPTAS